MVSYQIIETLDRGGFGKVCKVELEPDREPFALKELIYPNSVNMARFRREVNILQELRHPNIIRIVDVGLGGSPGVVGPFYVMDYMEGGSLAEFIKEIHAQGNFFSRKWTIDIIVLPVLSALEVAHARQIYHRDLKPANLLFKTEEKRDIVISDWGLGKDVNRQSIALTAAAGGVGGTPGYCAPEQWHMLGSADGLADIYSLGVIIYQMLTREMPPQYTLATEGLTRTSYPSPSVLNSKLTGLFEQIILKMIALQTSERYQSVSLVRADIERLRRIL